MANTDKTYNDIIKALGVDASKLDSGQVRKTKEAIGAAATQSNTTTKSSETIIGGLNGFITSLDKSTSASTQWNTNILTMADNALALSKNIMSMDFGKVFGSLRDIINPFNELDQSLRNNINKELGLTGKLSRDIRTSIIEAAEGTLEFGIGVGDITDVYVGLVKELGRATPLSKELLQNTAMWSRATGVSMSEAGSFLAKLENFGISINQGPKILEEMSDTARSMGLTTSKFMSYAAENLKLINTLGFEKGVRGFTEIAAKASSIGFNLQSAAGVAEKLFDIDNAVEMAAQLNVLGGDFGKLGNAIDLMFSPTNDMEGFTDSLMSATKEFVTFNSEKNTFDVSPLDLRRAREFAKATGLSLEEVIDTGKRLSKMEMIKDSISFIPNLTDEERDLIGSLGQLNENGEVTIKGKTVTELANLGQLSGAISELKQEDAEGKMSQKEILNEQLNMFSKSNYYLKAIALKLGAFGNDGGLFNIIGNDLNDLVYSVLGNSEDTDKTMMGIIESLNSGNKEGFEKAFAPITGMMNKEQLSKFSIMKQGISEYFSGMEAYKASNQSGYNGAFNVKNNQSSQGAMNMQSLSYGPQQATPQVNTNLTLVMDGQRYQLTRDQWKAVNEITAGYIASIEADNNVTTTQ